MKKIAIGLTLFAASLLTGFLSAQSPYKNIPLGSLTMTSATTSPPISFGTTANSYSACALEVTGVALSTATIGVLGTVIAAPTSTDYFALGSLATSAAPGTQATTQTVTASTLLTFNCAALTGIKIITSGTFTATSITLRLTASPNAQVSKAAGGGTPAACVAGNNYACLTVANIFTQTQTAPVNVSSCAASFTAACFGSNLNATPTVTGFGFSDQNTVALISGANTALAANYPTHFVGIAGSVGLYFDSGDLSGGSFDSGQKRTAVNEITDQNYAGTRGTRKVATLGANGTPGTAGTGEVIFGGLTAAVSNCGAIAAACLVINVAGVTHYLPYF